MEEELQRVVGRLASPLALGGVPPADHPAVDLLHQVQLRATGAELSLAAPLAMATQEFPAGEITPRELHALYPYPNTLVVVHLSGAQVRDVLEHAVRGWSGVECREPASCTLYRDPALPGYGYDTLEGATYVVDVTQPAGSRIRALRVRGELMDPGQMFSVALNSYRAAGSGGFPHLKSAPRLREIDRQMVDLLADYFAAEGVVTPGASENFFFVIPLAAATGAPRAGTR
jgi:2',3'-cyclic-nucleotide 2'-phosphodiesterase/3'-nucleotidase